MFETPYQTTPCKRFSLEKAATGVRKLEINDELLQPPGAHTGVKIIPPGLGDFPPFQQPITKSEIPTLEASVVLDGRQLLRADGRAVKEDVLNHAVLSANLTSMWIDGGAAMRKDMLNLGEFPAKVFGSWLGQALALRLSLDLGQSAMLRAVTSIYYIQLFDPLPENATDDDRDKILIRAVRSTPGVDYDTLLGILGTIPVLSDINDYVAYVKKVIDSPRTEQLNISLIYTALGHSWGPQYREAVAVALEYPPIFLSLVYTTCKQRSYTKTGLGKIIERVVYRDNDREFVKNVNHLTGTVG